MYGTQQSVSGCVVKSVEIIIVNAVVKCRSNSCVMSEVDRSVSESCFRRRWSNECWGKILNCRDSSLFPQCLCCQVVEVKVIKCSLNFWIIDLHNSVGDLLVNTVIKCGELCGPAKIKQWKCGGIQEYVTPSSCVIPLKVIFVDTDSSAVKMVCHREDKIMNIC